MGNMTSKVLIILAIVGLIFFAGSASAHNATINLSAGPEAEGQRLIDQANAEGIAAQTDEARALAAFNLEEAKKKAEDLREAAVNRANMWQKALMFGGSFFILWVFVFGGINLMSSWGIWNMRVLLTPIKQSSGHGKYQTHLFIPFPAVPFFAIQTWDAAPTSSAWLQVGQAPMLYEGKHVELLALAQMLDPDEESDNKLGNMNLMIRKLGLMLEGVPTRILDETSSRRD